MVTETLELIVRTSGASSSASEIREIATAASSAQRSVSAMAETMRLMRNVLVGLSFARVFVGLSEGVSQAQSIMNLFRTVTKNSQDAQAAFDHFAALAMKTRTPFEDIAKLAVQVSRTLGDTPDKLQKIDAIVTNISESFVVAGMNGNQIRNVIRDINEMFAGGTVIMRQFRAVLQQDRPLLDAISQSVVATGANAAKFNKILQDAQKNGTLSGGTLVEALKAAPGALQGSDIQRALEGPTLLQSMFGKTAATIDQAITNLETAWLKFVGDIDASNGVFTSIANSILYVSNNLEAFLYIATAVAALLAVRYIALPLAIWFTSVAQAVAMATVSMVVFGVQAAISTAEAIASVISLAASWAAFSSEVIAMSAAQALVSFIGLLVGAAAELAIFAAGFAVLATAAYAAYSALAAFVAPLAQLGALRKPFDDMKISMQNLPDVVNAVGQTLISEWPLVTKTIEDLWNDMLNSMTNRFNAWWAGIDVKVFTVVSLMNPSAGRLLGSAMPDLKTLPTNTAAGDIDKLQHAIEQNYQQNYHNKHGPLMANANPSLIGGTDTGVPNTALAPATVQQMAAAQSELSELLGRFGGPADKYAADIEKVNSAIVKLTTATKTHSAAMLVSKVDAELVAAGFSKLAETTDKYGHKVYESTTLNQAMMRSVLGLKNTDIDLKNTENAVSQALKLRAISQAEAMELVKKATVANEQYKLSQYKGTPQEAQAGAVSGFLAAEANKQSPFEVAATYAEKLVATGDAARNLAIDLGVVNQALKDHVISAQQATNATRDLEIEFLKTQQDAGSGFALGMLEAQKSMNDVAQTASGVVTHAFEGLTDELTKFFTTGKINMKQWTQELESGLVKVAVQQNITGPLATMLGGGNSPNGGILGSILSPIFGSAATPGASGQLGASEGNAMWVQLANGAFSSLGLGEGGGGPGANGGGSFTPVSQGGLMDLFSGSGVGPGGYGGGGNSGAFGGGSLFGNSGIVGSLFSGGGSNGIFGAGGLFGSGGFFGNLLNGTGGIGTTSNWLLNEIGLGGQGGLLGASGLSGVADSIFGPTAMSSALDAAFATLPFANGGEFTVGGQGGVDSQLVAFRATPDETVTIRRPGEPSRELGAQNSFHVHLHGGGAVDTFNRSPGQTAASMAALASRVNARNGHQMSGKPRGV